MTIDFRNGKFIDISNRPPYWNEKNIAHNWKYYSNHPHILKAYWTKRAQVMARFLWGSCMIVDFKHGKFMDIYGVGDIWD